MNPAATKPPRPVSGHLECLPPLGAAGAVPVMHVDFRISSGHGCAAGSAASRRGRSRAGRPGDADPPQDRTGSRPSGSPMTAPAEPVRPAPARKAHFAAPSRKSRYCDLHSSTGASFRRCSQSVTCTARTTLLIAGRAKRVAVAGFRTGLASSHKLGSRACRSVVVRRRKR